MLGLFKKAPKLEAAFRPEDHGLVAGNTHLHLMKLSAKEADDYLRQIPAADGLRARLIDWDHTAVGPASYDLSTFLLRFPSEHRRWVLDLYRKAVAGAGRYLPGERELNRLFETHEYARFANRIIWPAIALVMEHAAWGVEELAEIDRWFGQFEPVLPVAEEFAV